MFLAILSSMAFIVQDDTSAQVSATYPPTVLPRSLPARDVRGEAFGDRVSLSPDGTRIALVNEVRRGFTVTIATVGRNEPQTQTSVNGEPAFIGWRDNNTLIIGTRSSRTGRGDVAFRPLDITLFDIAQSRHVDLEAGGSRLARRAWTLSNGVYAIDPRTGSFVHDAAGGRALAAFTAGTSPTVTECCEGASFAVQAANTNGPSLTLTADSTGENAALTCPASSATMRVEDGSWIVPAGPADGTGTPVVMIDANGDSRYEALAYYSCTEGIVEAPFFESDNGFAGALFNPRSGSYYGVWTGGASPSAHVFDTSLAHDLAEVEASFGSPVTVYPIDIARGGNNVLLYVSGPEVAGAYFVLDRYAGYLDMIVQYSN